MENKEIDKKINKELLTNKKLWITVAVLIGIELILKFVIYKAYSPYNKLIDFISENTTKIEYVEPEKSVQLFNFEMKDIFSNYNVTGETNNTILYENEEGKILIQHSRKNETFNNQITGVVTLEDQNRIFKERSIVTDKDLYTFIYDRESITNFYFDSQKNMKPNAIFQTVAKSSYEINETITLIDGNVSGFIRENDKYKSLIFYIGKERIAISITGKSPVENMYEIASSIKVVDSNEG